MPDGGGKWVGFVVRLSEFGEHGSGSVTTESMMRMGKTKADNVVCEASFVWLRTTA